MASLLRRRSRRILVDVDMQFDLLDGSDAERGKILRNTRRLMAWARLNHMPVISTLLTRQANGNGNGGKAVKCLEGTEGHKKISYTLLPSHLQFGSENCTDLPRHLFSRHQQLIFEKRTEDPFEQARAERLLSEMRIDDFVIFGTSLEVALKYTALGLLHRKKRVTLVTDAIFGTNTKEGN
ncbi:MAG: cysteine hydrolase, partial [Sedimentisphaerales bacterium]|nr:cysteine hydrolase [Sedimentisphaerales bacterium]